MRYQRITIQVDIGCDDDAEAVERAAVGALHNALPARTDAIFSDVTVVDEYVYEVHE